MMIHLEVKQQGPVWRATLPGVDSCWAEDVDPARAVNLIKVQVLHWVAESLSLGQLAPDNSFVIVPHMIPEVENE